MDVCILHVRMCSINVHIHILYVCIAYICTYIRTFVYFLLTACFSSWYWDQGGPQVVSTAKEKTCCGSEVCIYVCMSCAGIHTFESTYVRTFVHT